MTKNEEQERSRIWCTYSYSVKVKSIFLPIGIIYLTSINKY